MLGRVFFKLLRLLERAVAGRLAMANPSTYGRTTG
jgi:hypothetical protein